MDSFPSLEDFLMLREPHDIAKRSQHMGFQPFIRGDDCIAEGLVSLYKIAKANWEMYGDKGLPIGTKIFSLRMGRSLCSSIFKGVYSDDDRYFFGTYKEKSDNACFPDREHTHLICIQVWWTEITTKEAIEKLGDERFLKEIRGKI